MRSSRPGAPGSNFGDLAAGAALLRPSSIAIEQEGISLTYGQLEERTSRAASLFADLGIGPGTSVLLLLPNDYRFVEILLGVLRTGGVVIPGNIRLGADTLTYLAEHSEATVLVVHEALAEKAEQIVAGAPGLRHTLVVGEAPPFGTSYDQALNDASSTFETVTVEPDDLALLMYTSGSTGVPKGCMLSHRNKWFQARSSARTMLHHEHDKALVMGPLYHANAFWACMLPMLFVGGSMVILPGFDPARVLETINRYRPTYTSGTPSMFNLLLTAKEEIGRAHV